jgi:hypothetical protein
MDAGILDQLFEMKAKNEQIEVVSPEKLREFAESMKKKYIFQVNDLVTWKPGMRYARRPNYGEAAIVVRMLDEPVKRVTEDPSSNNFCRVEDIVVGVVIEDQYEEYVLDSRRLMPLPSLEAPKE